MKNKFLGILLVGGFYLTFVTSVSASTYFVSSSGSDTNAGTQTLPWKTIQKAANTVVAGDTVYVRAGTYAPFYITRSGNSAAPITISGYTGEQVIIDGAGRAVDSIALKGSSYVKISNFEVKGSSYQWGAGIRIFPNGSTFASNNTISGNKVYGNLGLNTSGIIIQDSSFNKILDNEVYNNNWVGIWTIQHDSVVPSGITSNEITGNKVYGNVGSIGNSDGIGFLGAHNSNNIVKNNESYGNGDDGIDTWESHDNLISNNISHDNILGDGNGFKVGGSTTGGHNTIVGNISFGNKSSGFDSNNSGFSKFYNNLAYNNAKYGFEDGYRGSCCTTDPNVFINNIGMNNATGNLSAGAATSVSHNNIWFSAQYNNPQVLYLYAMKTSLSAFYSASGNRLDNPNGGSLASYSVNPMFTNASIADFNLTSGSPAIDKGDSSNPGGIIANGLPDIGALEYNGAAAVKQGDANGDNIVNESDYSIWLSHFNQIVTGYSNGDFNLSGKVDGVDYVIWLNNFGK